MSTLKAINLQHPSATNPAIVLATDGSAAGNFSSNNGGPLAGFRNRIINGNFDIWQRGTSFSNPANNEYTADRWVVTYDGSGATRTVSQQIFNPGSTEAALGAAFFLRHAQTVAGSGGTFNTLNQRIEGVRTYEGQTVTISFYARGTSASLTLSTIGIRQIFGAGGSAEVFTTVASSVVIAGSTFARYTYTVTVPSITGKTVGTSAFLELIFNLPLNNTFSIDIASIQLEPGPVATPFEQRPIGTELSLCQRYYEQVNAFWIGDVTNGITYGTMFTFAVQKRATPTMASITQAGTANGGMNTRSPGAFGSGKGGSTTATAATTTVAGGFSDIYAASAEL